MQNPINAKLPQRHAQASGLQHAHYTSSLQLLAAGKHAS